MRPDWQSSIVGLVLIVALIGVGLLLGVAVARWSPDPPVVDCICRHECLWPTATPIPVWRDTERIVCEPGESVCARRQDDGRYSAYCCELGRETPR
jgi:hypothetical protein